MSHAIKFTSRVRRGLALVAKIATLTEDDAPGFTVTSRWTLTQQREFNLALDWIEQQNAEPPVGRDPTPEESAMVAELIGHAPMNGGGR
jgi:hypothetical protein